MRFAEVRGFNPVENRTTAASTRRNRQALMSRGLTIGVFASVGHTPAGVQLRMGFRLNDRADACAGYVLLSGVRIASLGWPG